MGIPDEENLTVKVFLLLLLVCPVSGGLQFYNPANGTFVSSIDYRFQDNVMSGSYFGLKYQPGTFI
jgi:hypothetical protein